MEAKRRKDTLLLQTLPTLAQWQAGVERAFLDLVALHQDCHSFTSTSSTSTTSSTNLIPAWVHYAANTTMLGIIFTTTYVGRPGFFTDL
eukprot:3215646-Amphidinium_carterae.1